MTHRFGFFAAIAALVFAVGYGIPQILQITGTLTDPWDRILIFAPSLALAPSFVLTMAAVHAAAPSERRVFSLAALSLAIMYGTLVSIVYVVQLGSIIPHDLRRESAAVAAFACCNTGQPLTAVDLLGYTLMSLSTLVAVPVFHSASARLWLFLNGILAPVLILQLAWPKLIYIGALWLITFPLAMLFVALALRRTPSDGRM